MVVTCAPFGVTRVQLCNERNQGSTTSSTHPRYRNVAEFRSQAVAPPQPPSTADRVAWTRPRARDTAQRAQAQAGWMRLLGMEGVGTDERPAGSRPIALPARPSVAHSNGRRTGRVERGYKTRPCQFKRRRQQQPGGGCTHCQGKRGRIRRRARAVRIVGRAGMTRGQGGRSGAAAPNNGRDALTEDP